MFDWRVGCIGGCGEEVCTAEVGVWIVVTLLVREGGFTD